MGVCREDRVNFCDEDFLGPWLAEWADNFQRSYGPKMDVLQICGRHEYHKLETRTD